MIQCLRFSLRFTPREVEVGKRNEIRVKRYLIVKAGWWIEGLLYFLYFYIFLNFSIIRVLIKRPMKKLKDLKDLIWSDVWFRNITLAAIGRMLRVGQETRLFFEPLKSTREEMMEAWTKLVAVGGVKWWFEEMVTIWESSITLSWLELMFSRGCHLSTHHHWEKNRSTERRRWFEEAWGPLSSFVLSSQNWVDK